MVNKISTETRQNHIEREGETTFDYGQYYRYEQANVELDKDFTVGEIYIVISMAVHHISKNVHALTLAIPVFAQKGHKTAVRVSIKQIEASFKFVEAGTAKAIRDRQLQAIQHSVNTIQSDMKTALTNPQKIMSKIMADNNDNVKLAVATLDFSVPLLPPPAALSSSSAVSSVGGQHVEVLRKQLLNQQKLGNVISVYSSEKHTELVALLNHTADIQLEQAKAVKGQAHAMIESFADVESKIDQISLYVGDSVKVVNVCNKPVSPHREQFVFFSHMVFIDDEMLTHQLFSDSSFDHNSIDRFFEHLNDNRLFRDRIFPTERCVVVVRPRRRSLDYTDCPFTNEILNVGNFSSFLMVRDGERISAVYSTIDYQQRLFPTQAELERHFSTITDADDVRLTDAQKRLDTLAGMYLKVASVLQGVCDRQQSGGDVVFGELVCERFAGSFFDPDAIERNVKFINDEDYLLGDKPYLTAPQSWIDQHYNDNFGEGDLIFIDSAVIDESNAPQAYHFPVDAFDADPVSTWRLDDVDDGALKVVRFNDKERAHCIQITAVNVQYGTKLYGKTRNMRVKLLSDTPRYLNIRHLKLTELLDIMASRVARSYINNEVLMPVLLKARETIQALMLAYQPYIEQVQQKHPEIATEDAYIGALNFILSKDSANYATPPPAKRGWIDAICQGIIQQTILTDDMYTQAEKFALSKDEMPICVAQLPQSAVLVVGRSLEKTQSMVASAEKYLEQHAIFTDLTLYHMTGTGEFANKGLMGYKQAMQLKRQRYYPLGVNTDHDPFNPLVGKGEPSPLSARQRKQLKQQMASAYHQTVAITADVAMVESLMAAHDNGLGREKIKHLVAYFKSVVSRADPDAQQRLFDELLSEISKQPYVDASDDEKRDTIAIARLQAVVGWGMRPPKYSSMLSSHDVHAAVLVVDLFAMIAQLLAVMQGSQQQTNHKCFNAILLDTYFVNPSHIESLKAKWQKKKIISGFEVPLPLSHDIYDVDLSLCNKGFEADNKALEDWIAR